MLAASLAGFALFLALGILWHRPMLALAGAGPDRAVVDFHSHTNVSHDVRGTLMSGFDVGPISPGTAAPGSTPSSSPTTTRSQPATPARGLPLRCPGIEVSAWRAHIVLLGDTLPVDRGPYSRDWARPRPPARG